MTKSFGEIDRLVMDIISGSMYSLNFLRNISVAIFDQRIADMTVREFHAARLKNAKYTGHSVPYCLGPILGFLYCGILLSKERWFEFLPEDSIKEATPDWGFTGANYKSPKEPNPSIKYTIRRIRNALAHGNILINVPHDLDYKKNEFEFEKRTPRIRQRTSIKSLEERPPTRSSICAKARCSSGVLLFQLCTRHNT